MNPERDDPQSDGPARQDDPVFSYDYGGLGMQSNASTAGQALSGWWARVWAFVIDMLVVGVPAYIILYAISNGKSTKPTDLAEIAILIAEFAYFAFLDGGLTGQTVGKRVLGIATRDADTGGSIGPGRAFLRYVIISILASIFFVPLVIDCMWPLWDRNRQAWHDKAARSVVVKVR